MVGRGGIIPNIVAGGYVVDDNLTDCLLHHTVFDHASNLGGLMAREFAEPLRIPAYIYDAVTSDELPPEAVSLALRRSPAPASATSSTPEPPATNTPRPWAGNTRI